MATYADRYAGALAAALGDDVAVTNAQGIIVIELRGARVTISPPENVDRRGPVSGTQVRDGLASAARKLSAEIPRYRESFREPARILAEYLRVRSVP